MRLEDKSLSFVVNFLLGVSWAFIFLGAITSFLSSYQDSFLFAIIFTFIGAIPGMVAVLFLELVITSKEKHLELKKQTALLEKLVTQKEDSHNLP